MVAAGANIICTRTAAYAIQVCDKKLEAAVYQKRHRFQQQHRQGSLLADSKSSYASVAIDDILKAMRENIVRFNLLLNFFEEKYPGFVKAYRKAIIINYSGIRHSGIEGFIKNSSTGQPIQDVTITGGKKKTTLSGKDDVYKLIKLKISDMKITITAPGYDSQVIDVKIISGKIIELNIVLSAYVTNMATA